MLGVARRNPAFRRLWLAQVVSETGDWLNRVAILTLIGALGGPAEGLKGLGLLFGLELATRLLPTALMGPLAGPVADRLPRRFLMIAADVLRAAIVLCLLAVRGPEHLPLLYTLLVLQMGVGIFFQSARSASIPNTVPRAELHEAYALSAVTWSTMLSLGALFGGLLVRWVGPYGVFVLDAATYLGSAVLLIGLRLPPAPEHAKPLRLSDVLLLAELRRALTHVRSLGLTAVVFAKSFWGGAGGYLVLLSLTANERFAGEGETETLLGPGTSVATAVGLLYFARGVGTGIGPILARRWSGSTEQALRRQVAAGFGIGALGYALFALCHNLWAAVACVVFAHMGGSALWVASTILWQNRVADEFRGRVYALEFLGMTLTFSAGGFLAGRVYDTWGSLNVAIALTCAVVVASGLAWTLAARARSSVRDRST